ncbi:hypothetical protein BU17DRAFT_65825 [Hysterangium stoloniferum]|nr:hypothetical protein BU17DRAFT_65825 [Hysterangium stoloniferum]
MVGPTFPVVPAQTPQPVIKPNGSTRGRYPAKSQLPPVGNKNSRGGVDTAWKGQTTAALHVEHYMIKNARFCAICVRYTHNDERCQLMGNGATFLKLEGICPGCIIFPDICASNWSLQRSSSLPLPGVVGYMVSHHLDAVACVLTENNLAQDRPTFGQVAFPHNMWKSLPQESDCVIHSGQIILSWAGLFSLNTSGKVGHQESEGHSLSTNDQFRDEVQLGNWAHRETHSTAVSITWIAARSGGYLPLFMKELVFHG